MAEIGTVEVTQRDNRTLSVKGRLYLDNVMAQAVYERMLLPSDDPAVLSQLSVGFSYDKSMNTKDANGVVVIHDATLNEVSVVHAGAQDTAIVSVKNIVAEDSDARVVWINPANDPRNVLATLDAIERKSRPKGADVDAFVTRVRAERVEESLEAARADSF